MPRPYHSIAIRPRRSTTNASVSVAQRLVQRSRAAIVTGEADMPDLFQRQFEGCGLL
jgi:hypothetical protein